MSDSAKNFVSVFLEELRQIVRDEVRASPSRQDIEDRLLTADEAAELLGVSPDWLYRHAKKLPFTRKLGPKMLRFSTHGILKWQNSQRAN